MTLTLNWSQTRAYQAEQLHIQENRLQIDKDDVFANNISTINQINIDHNDLIGKPIDISYPSLTFVIGDIIAITNLENNTIHNESAYIITGIKKSDLIDDYLRLMPTKNTDETHELIVIKQPSPKSKPHKQLASIYPIHTKYPRASITSENKINSCQVYFINPKTILSKINIPQEHKAQLISEIV